MSPEIKTVLITLFSLTMGWSLNELSSYFKAKKEEKNSIREVLHIQLNIWFIIGRTNINFFRKAVKQTLQKRGVSDDNSLKQFDYIFKSFIESIMLEIFSKGIKDIELKYKDKIEKLAIYYPFLAYKIADKQVLHNYFNTLERYFRKVEEGFGNTILLEEKETPRGPVTNEQAMDRLRNLIKPFLYNQAIESIETDILLISKKLGFLSYYRAKGFLKRKSEKEFVEEYLEQIDQLIIEFEKSNLSSK